MSSPERNEVKTRLTDEVFAALVEVRRAYGFESEAKALSFVAERGLFGMVRTIPKALVDRSPAVAHVGS